MIFLRTSFLFFLLSVFAFGEVKKLEDVSVQLKWFYQYQFAGILVAKEKGFYEEQGLNVTIKERDPKQNNILQVIHGEAEYGIADSVILRYRAEGHPVKVIATIFQHNAMVLISKKESGIVSPYEMKGKKISFQKGLDDSIISSLMSFANLGEDDYIKMPMDFSHMNFVNGEVDICEAYISIEPYWLKERYNIDVNVIDPKNYGIDFYGDMIFTTEQEIKNHPHRVEAFKKATLKGWSYALDHKEEAIKIILEKYNTQNLNFDQLLYEARVTENLIATKYIPLGDMKQERFISLARIYSTKGISKIKMNEAQDSIIYDQHKRQNIFLKYLQEFILLVVFLFLLVLALILNNRRLHFLVREKTELLEIEKDKAIEASEYKSRFLANMSHEIRTPMNAILGFIEQLKKEETDIKRLKLFEVIENSGESLLGIINDILDISKIESGKMEPNLEAVDVYKIFHDIDEMFSKTCKEKNIYFSLELSMKLDPILMLDKLRFKQIIVNLVGNAVKFTSNNGSIRLKVFQKGEMLQVEVKDSGIGIKEENLGKIFESFEQEDSSTTRNFGGTGLGLSISYKLAHLLKGDLTVQSNYGAGSTFTLTTPYIVGEKTLQISKEQKNDTAPKKRNIKVLIVEDNKTNQLLLSMILEELDVAFEIANDGIEALEMVEKNTYDLIFMDENMPRLNGMEATRQIRIKESENLLHHTPIIAVTANALSGDKERFLDAGMDGYIPKPYHEEDIKRVLYSHVK